MLPTGEAVEEDLRDVRSPAEKRAAAGAEVAGVRTHADHERATLAADVAAHSATVRKQGAARRADVVARAAAARATNTARAVGARAQLAAQAGARRAEVRAQVDADANAAREVTAAQVNEARTALGTRRTALSQAAEAERARSLGAADAEATRAVAEIEAAAVDCERAGERQAARFPGDDDPAPEQRAAARKVGRESAADIRAKKPSVAPDLRARAVEHGQRCTEYARTVTAKIDEAERTLVDSLQASGRQAETTIRDGLAGALAAVDNRLRADLAAVDATATALLGQLASAETRTVAALDADTGTAAAELAAAGNGLDAELDATATETTGALSGPEQPFLPGVVEQAQAARATLTGTGAAGRAHLGTAAAGADARFATTAAAFAATADAASADAAARFPELVQGFLAATERAAAARRAAAAQVVDGLRRRQQEVTRDVLAEADKAVADARTELARMGGDYDRTMRDAAHRAVEEATRPKTDDVDTRAAEAANQVDDGFWAGLGRALVQIAIGLVVLVVVALVVAAIAAAFGVLLTAWTAIMIAGAILLAVSLVVALVHRLGQPELAGRPGTAILVALADTVGITGIYEACKGRDIVTGSTLSTGQRTERGVLGAVTLVSLIIGARSAIKGPPGGAFVRPVSGVPGWASLGVFGRALVGISGVAAEIAGAMARGVRSVREWWASRKPATQPGEGANPHRPPPRPGELPPEQVDPSITRVSELSIVDEIGRLPEGVEAPPNTRVVTIRVNAPDGSFGHVTHAFDPATGQLYAVQLDLSLINVRSVTVTPGQRPVPLSDYLAIRAMRLLNVSVGRLRTVRVHDVESVRTVLQVRAGVAPAETQLGKSHVDTVIRAGGRVVGATIEGGSKRSLGSLLRMWEGETPPPDMVARHDAILRDFELTRAQADQTPVHANFDIVLRLESPLPVPIVPPPVRRDAGTD